MASVQIINDTASIKVVTGGVTRNIPKPYIVTLDNDYIHINSQLFFHYTDITNLTVTSAENAQVQINNFQAFLQQSSLPFAHQVMLGLVPGVSSLHKFGKRILSQVDTDIFNYAPVTEYTFSDKAQIGAGFDYFAASDNVLDTMDIRIMSYDKDMNFESVTITLNGQTPVKLPGKKMGIVRMKVVGPSSLAGQFVVTEGNDFAGGVPNTPADVRGYINDGDNRTFMAILTVPAGKTAIICNWSFALAKKQGAVVEATLLERAIGESFSPLENFSVDNTGSSHVQHEFAALEPLAEFTDIKAIGNSDTNTTGVSSDFDVFFYDNNLFSL